MYGVETACEQVLISRSFCASTALALMSYRSGLRVWPHLWGICSSVEESGTREHPTSRSQLCLISVSGSVRPGSGMETALVTVWSVTEALECLTKQQQKDFFVGMFLV